MDTVMRLLFTAVFGGLAIMLLVIGVRERVLQDRVLAGAKPVEAVVVSSRVVKAPERRDGKETASYRPEVRFEYEIAGVTHESDMLRPTVIVRSYGSEQSAAEELRAFATGARVRAFVNPQHPARAFLIAERSSAPIGFVVIGLVVLAGAVAAYKFL